jgi:ribosomal protein S25
MILPPNFLFKTPKAIPATGKYRENLENCGKKQASKVGEQGNKEKSRRIQQLANQGIKEIKKELKTKSEFTGSELTEKFEKNNV